jgi:hypothetical protein
MKPFGGFHSDDEPLAEPAKRFSQRRELRRMLRIADAVMPAARPSQRLHRHV